MDSLYLLLPLSVLLALVVLGVFAWAVHHGQFDDLEREAARVLEEPGACGAPATAAGSMANASIEA
ncbi:MULTISPECIES: cbb3-type cytochrome oxidase assembly protein CcoS [unclassified Methylibium]|uniref:cbb3-type cytochrome oxidase assembly protein CcoS n=1 Tax=unclassified Methylibium TaxID=2633235 RepID=UPI0009EB81AB|nr:cbb3-type cytochrome oxidase assembly protein CcoS [Methylibium sp. Root1272]